MTGPKKAQPQSLESGIKHALNKADVEVIDSDDLAEMESAGTEMMAARDLDADFVLSVSIAAVKKSFRADAKLIASKDGTVAWSASKTFAKNRSWKAGRALGWLVVKKLKELRDQPVRIAPVVIPKDEVEPKKKPEETTAVAAIAPAEKEETHPDDRIFRASLSGGSQLSGEYTVAVGGAPTGLAYELRPTALIAGELLVNLPWLPLSAEVSIAYVPMFYDIDVEPAITPNRPGARHLDFAGSIGYGFRLWLFALRPLAGITYRSLAVQKQEPINVLVGASSIAPHIGLRAGLRIGDLTMEVEGLFRLVASYRESPDTTGQSGFGTSYLAGASARYWITDFLAAYAEVAYDFTRVGFDGAGTRIKFEGDPDLMSATVYAAEIRAALGVAFAL